MVYQQDPAHPPPRRAYTANESHGQMMHPAQRPLPQQQYGGNHYGPPRGDHSMRSQSQRRPPPPQQHGNYGNYGYDGGANYSDPNYGLENGMRNLTMSPPNVPNMGNGQHDPHMNGSGRGQRPPPAWNRGRGRGMPPPQQRMPPPRMPLHGRGGHPMQPRGMPPPPLQQQQHDWGMDQQYGNAYPEDYRPVQRSATMPIHQEPAPPAEPVYTAYNPAMAGGYNGARPQDRRMDHLQAEASWGPRESVGALLDSYYSGDTESPPMEQSHPGQNGGPPKPNFSRPQLDHNRNPNKEPADPYWNGAVPASDFSHQAYRSRSQPDLRNGSRGGSVELPAGFPPPPMHPNGYAKAPHGSRGGSVELPAGYPPPPMHPNGYAGVANGPTAGNQYPPRKASYPSRDQPPPQNADSLPEHPDPASMREAERQYSAESVPGHPAPVRPGLIHNDHPPPQRQYDTDSNSMASAPSNEPQPITKAELEQLSNAAKMNPGDSRLQLALAKKLVEAAAVLANEGGRADVKTTRKNRENYIFDAHKIVKRLANSSHPYPDAVFYLASCYGEGQLGLQVDHERAYNLYQSAAKLNHGASAYRTAVCCELGAGVRRDPNKAITWYKKAAALGETPAMFKLGMIQWKGLLGQPRNPRDGLIWLKRAADQADENNQHALHELGLLYERTDGGDVIIPDPNYARELFMKAAELGYPASQFRMGCAYEYGNMGCPIDPRKSIAWYSKAAMKGDIESQLALSGWYLTGSDGVIQQSDTEAYLWARKAAEKGLAKAEYALGYFTEVGIGVPANLEDAKRWYYKAANQQHPKAQQRLQELKKGGASAQKPGRERLSRTNKTKDDSDCVIM